MMNPRSPSFESSAIPSRLHAGWRAVEMRDGFSEWYPPLLESDVPYVKLDTDLHEQFYGVTDWRGQGWILRPGGPVSLARALAANPAAGATALQKWFFIGECFRSDFRQRKGRVPNFTQFVADITGDPGIGADAEVIALCAETLCSFGLSCTDFHIRISDMTLMRGCGENLAPHPEALRDVADCDRTFDRLKSAMKPDSVEAVHLARLEALFIRLGECGLSDFIRFDGALTPARGYHTGLIFKAYANHPMDVGCSLAGGGRYDNLVEALGGPATPGVGFSMGDTSLGFLLRARGLCP